MWQMFELQQVLNDCRKAAFKFLRSLLLISARSSEYVLKQAVLVMQAAQSGPP